MTGTGRVGATAAALVVALPRVAGACPVCFGLSDGPMAQATNMGIFAMLGVTACMLAVFAAFFVRLARRASLAETTAVPDAPAGAGQEGSARC